MWHILFIWSPVVDIRVYSVFSFREQPSASLFVLWHKKCASPVWQESNEFSKLPAWFSVSLAIFESSYFLHFCQHLMLSDEILRIQWVKSIMSLFWRVCTWFLTSLGIFLMCIDRIPSLVNHWSMLFAWFSVGLFGFFLVSCRGNIANIFQFTCLLHDVY